MTFDLRTFPIPTPFPVGPVNAHYLPGRVPALVDTGPKTPEASAALSRATQGLALKVVIVTHHHVDHGGLARYLQAERGAEVWIHEREAPTLERWQEGAAERERDHEAGLRAAAVPAPERERMRYGGRKYDGWGESVPPDRRIGGGDRFVLGDDAWEVVDAPGHTGGSFLLHSASARATFSGDTLLEHITPNAVSVRASERAALITYLDTLRNLRKRDWGRVHPGHGRSFDDAGRVIDRGLLHAERRQARVLRSVGREDTTAWQIVHVLFPGLPHSEVFLAVSEVLGHLEHLRRQGLVQVEERDGVDLYRRNGQS